MTRGSPAEVMVPKAGLPRTPFGLLSGSVFVLHEELKDARSRTNHVLLQVYRERLHLTRKKTRVEQGRHRVERLRKERVAPEELPALSEVPVEPHVELVLIQLLVGDAAVVVGRPRQVRQRMLVPTSLSVTDAPPTLAPLSSVTAPVTSD